MLHDCESCETLRHITPWLNDDASAGNVSSHAALTAAVVTFGVSCVTCRCRGKWTRRVPADVGCTGEDDPSQHNHRLATAPASPASGGERMRCEIREVKEEVLMSLGRA